MVWEIVVFIDRKLFNIFSPSLQAACFIISLCSHAGTMAGFYIISVDIDPTSDATAGRLTFILGTTEWIKCQTIIFIIKFSTRTVTIMWDSRWQKCDVDEYPIRLRVHVSFLTFLIGNEVLRNQHFLVSLWFSRGRCWEYVMRWRTSLSCVFISISLLHTLVLSMVSMCVATDYTGFSTL